MPRVSKFLILAIVLALVLMVLPSVYPNDFALTILTYANIMAVVAASWDFFTGLTGRFNFGQALFFGVGAYAAGFMNLNLRYGPILTIPLAGTVAVVIGVAFGYPTLRLKGPYFALATLIFPLIAGDLTFSMSSVFGGEHGLYGLTSISDSFTVQYYGSLLMMLVTVLVFIYLAGTRLGLALESIRDDEKAAAATGMNVTRYKLMAYMISAFFTGMAGAYQAQLFKFVGPNTFSSNISFEVIAMTIIGGIATIVGPILGAYILVIVLDGLGISSDFSVLIYGILLLAIVLTFQGGLLGRLKSNLRGMRIRRMMGEKFSGAKD
jgi:branched-chain amino acid transport system permease protein